MASSVSHHVPSSDHPIIANFDSANITIGAGVAIFHIASARVVVCRHSTQGYWFLPKGRRDAGENSTTGAEREGFEESGYRNRLLPIPLRHRQPQAHNSSVSPSPFVTEPIWTQLMPVGRTSQYILFWYIAETLPPDVDAALTQQTVAEKDAYQIPPAFPEYLTLQDRVALEEEGFEPVRHPNTGVNEDEKLYESYLLLIDEAMRKLRGTIMADVVRRGWEAVCARRATETTKGSGGGY